MEEQPSAGRERLRQDTQGGVIMGDFLQTLDRGDEREVRPGEPLGQIRLQERNLHARCPGCREAPAERVEREVRRHDMALRPAALHRYRPQTVLAARVEYGSQQLFGHLVELVHGPQEPQPTAGR